MGETHARRHQQVEWRLHEARQLAYEYAKQIVFKAYELSQQQARVSSSENHINNHERPPVANERGQVQLEGPIRRRLFEEAAEQINGRLRLSALDPATKQERRQQPPDGDPAAAALYLDDGGQWRRPSLTGAAVTDTSHRGDHDDDPRRQRQQQASVYIEQDYATISSDEQQQQQQQRAASSTAGRRRKNDNQSGRRRGLQQCLNWHLIVSCFSTCLPQAFGNRHASATSKASREGPTRV